MINGLTRSTREYEREIYIETSKHARAITHTHTHTRCARKAASILSGALGKVKGNYFQLNTSPRGLNIEIEIPVNPPRLGGVARLT